MDGYLVFSGRILPGGDRFPVRKIFCAIQLPLFARGLQSVRLLTESLRADGGFRGAGPSFPALMISSGDLAFRNAPYSRRPYRLPPPSRRICGIPKDTP